jgi:prepilin-type N-terminal cleavage/methylation domain-containing protein
MKHPAGSPERTTRADSAFTLTELMVVITIIAIISTVMMVSLGSTRGTSVQSAAQMVASALGEARQLAIATRSETRLCIALPNTGNNTKPFQAFSIIRKLKEDPQGRWVMVRDWTTLPAGSVINDISTGSYRTAAVSELAAALGQPSSRTIGSPGNSADAWRFVSSATSNLELVATVNSTNAHMAAPGAQNQRWSQVGYVGFGARGNAVYQDAAYFQGAGIRIASGYVTPNSQIVITDTNNWRYVETDGLGGRIVVRARENFRQ